MASSAAADVDLRGMNARRSEAPGPPIPLVLRRDGDLGPCRNPLRAEGSPQTHGKFSELDIWTRILL